MDIERLEELKGITEQLYQDGNVPLTYCDDVLELIDEAIARQTATSEEVTEAIEELSQASDRSHYAQDGAHVKTLISLATIDIAITALQVYQPWIPCSERMPTENDADENGHILAYSEGLQRSTICLWYHIIGDNTTTHWRKNIEPPKGE